ncbi:MAG: M1 family metallopeptidase [Flavobacteriales bacterium]
MINKKYPKWILAGAVVLTLNACGDGNSGNPQERSERTKMMIANAKLARDPHSYAQPNEVRVKHLNWVASVDFSAKVITATATYDLEHITEKNEVIFDMKGLQIDGVKVDGVPAKFTVGAEKEFIGAPLIVEITPTSKQVSISYRTPQGAEALLWVDGESPFLFTQSQAILGRTWLPCQDSPGLRITYDAQVTVPKNLMALMSAENPTKKNDTGVYSFKMDQPIPSYLMALAVGDVEFRSLGDRTGVYAIPSLIDAAAYEFEDMQKMLVAAEKLYGPYVWGRYDVLVLPPAFPFGGMENPKLTFATPTIIAGDKSLVSLIAHELAHSWSGNLVTNSTWDDFWINEGFTVYFEERIMEEVFGREYSEMLAQLSRQELDATISEISAVNEKDTWLKLSLENRNPDDAMTDIAYNKGYFFLRLCEETIGREKWDIFLKKYFTEHAFQVMDTEKFLAYLKSNLAAEKIEEKVNINEWVYAPGIPANIPKVQSDKMEKIKSVAEEFVSLKIIVVAIKWNDWSYQEKVYFITSIKDVSAAQMKALDRAFNITSTKNNEVLFAWLELAIRKNYSTAYDELESFLVEVGRRKFVAPLYEALVETNQKDLAVKIYTKARPNYHSVTIETIDKMLD